MTTLAWLILWIPFFAAGVIAFFLLSKPRAAANLAFACISFSFILALRILTMSLYSGPLHQLSIESSIPWIVIGSTKIEFGILLNSLTHLMLLIVTGIGSLIFLYSAAYM